MLKVLTFNINCYGEKHGPWPVRKELLCGILQELDPDIVALQAVCRDQTIAGGTDQVTQLAESLPDYRHHVFQPAIHDRDGDAQGQGWLAKISPAFVDHIELDLQPGHADPNPRIQSHARFELPTGPLHIFNAYFSWVEAQAEQNFREALTYMQSYSGLALLAGDFNTPADSDLLDGFRKAGWTDLWAKLHAKEPGLTFEAPKPEIRIDYAWANSELVERVRGIEIVSKETEDGKARPSDHLGLLVSLDLEKKA